MIVNGKIHIILSILLMEANHQNATQMTNTNTTLSSLESSDQSDQYIDGHDFVSELLSFEDWAMAEPELMGFGQTTRDFGYQENEFYIHGGTTKNQDEGENSSNIGGSRNTGEKKEVKGRVAFKMKSEIEVLDDGYKWRKYGKKMVKNSPNPRNYYRCSVVGCHVKKRIERDSEDPKYIITTYEGNHNHEISK